MKLIHAQWLSIRAQNNVAWPARTHTRPAGQVSRPLAISPIAYVVATLIGRVLQGLNPSVHPVSACHADAAYFTAHFLLVKFCNFPHFEVIFSFVPAYTPWAGHFASSALIKH